MTRWGPMQVEITVSGGKITAAQAVQYPSGNGRGSDKYLVFDQSIREGLRPAEAACDFFEPLFLRSVLVGVPASAK